MPVSADAVQAGLAAPLADMGVDLETVEIVRAGRRHVVRIVVDRDGGVDLDLVAAVSQRVSDLLDVPPLADELPGPFVLEVTSPGVDRPLTEPRHWRRAAGRLVHVQRRDGTALDGRVGSLDGEDAVIVRVGDADVVLPLADVAAAVVQVEFARVDEPTDDATDEPTDDASDDAGKE